MKYKYFCTRHKQILGRVVLFRVVLALMIVFDCLDLIDDYDTLNITSRIINSLASLIAMIVISRLPIKLMYFLNATLVLQHTANITVKIILRQQQ